jgi:thiamine biosynthesis protein ThiS
MTGEMNLMIKIIVNGEEQQLDDGLCVQDFLVKARQNGSSGVAVALNGEILHREQYARKRLKEGDSLELVQMTAGG